MAQDLESSASVWAARFVAVFALLTMCGGCSPSAGEQAKVRALSKAGEFFASFSLPRSESSDQAGLKDYRVFGTNPDALGVGWVAAGFPTVREVSTSPAVFEVAIPFWCRGTTLDGRVFKAQRQLAVSILDDGSSAKVQGHKLLLDNELSFFRQAFGWAFWGFALPLAIFPAARALLSIWLSQKGFSVGLAGGGAAVATLAAAAYLGYVFFGSLLAVACSVLAIIVGRVCLVKAFSSG